MEENIHALAYAIRESGIRVTVGKLPRLTTDRTSIEQIIGNLLSNAIKYIDSGRPGVIHIHAVEKPDEGRIVLRVEDNGRGIAPEEIGKIFILFQRAGRQDTEGEGMGLAYVRALARGLGGWISCESTPGVGTTFSVTLPTTPPAPPNL
ncbi:MAG: ATP-binding protein [Magnetococcales bacterium]|nr:ATP-binding protein [Magnetococcales bacterium]